MSTKSKYDLVINTAIIKSEKPSKGLEAITAANPHQANRIKGYLPDGSAVCVAQRPNGKGGMDFTKLMSGKIFAVAADSFSPVLEKAKNDKGESVKSNVQKQEDGLPLYSSSGFYSLSSKEYPAQEIYVGFTKLFSNGQKAYIIPVDNLKEAVQFDLASVEDLDDFMDSLTTSFESASNLVSKFDEGANKKRNRVIQTAKDEAEDNDETYAGVDFSPLQVDQADGNPFILLTLKVGSTLVEHIIKMEEESIDSATNKTTVKYLSKEEAIAKFKEHGIYLRLSQVLEAGTAVKAGFINGHIMRTSVSFKRRLDVLNESAEWPKFGDGPYVKGALNGWVKGIVTVMFSIHPSFPTKDYDSLHYVVALRQAEIGMNKSGSSSWLPPEAIEYNLTSIVLGLN